MNDQVQDARLTCRMSSFVHYLASKQLNISGLGWAGLSWAHSSMHRSPKLQWTDKARQEHPPPKPSLSNRHPSDPIQPTKHHLSTTPSRLPKSRNAKGRKAQQRSNNEPNTPPPEAASFTAREAPPFSPRCVVAARPASAGSRRPSRAAPRAACARTPRTCTSCRAAPRRPPCTPCSHAPRACGRGLLLAFFLRLVDESDFRSREKVWEKGWPSTNSGSESVGF